MGCRGSPSPGPPPPCASSSARSCPPGPPPGDSAPRSSPAAACSAALPAGGKKQHLPLCLLPPYTWPSPWGGGTHPGTQQGLPKKNPRGCRLILLAWGRGLPLGARPHRGTAHPEITYGCLGFGEVIDLKVEVFNLHLHGLAGLDGGRAGELGLLELRGHGSAPGLGARGHPQPLGGHAVGAASPDPPGS